MLVDGSTILVNLNVEFLRGYFYAVEVFTGFY